MATSVKVEKATKERLERLQAEIKLETGRKVTQQELLDRLVEHGVEDKEAIVDSYRDEWEGLTEEEKERFFSGTAASGDPVEEDEIDRVIYEEEILGVRDGESPKPE